MTSTYDSWADAQQAIGPSDLLSTVMAMRAQAQAMSRTWRDQADAAERRAKSFDPHDPAFAYATAEAHALWRCSETVLLIAGPPNSAAFPEQRQGGPG